VRSAATARSGAQYSSAQAVAVDLTMPGGALPELNGSEASRVRQSERFAKMSKKSKNARRQVLEKMGARAEMTMATETLPVGTRSQRVAARLQVPPLQLTFLSLKLTFFSLKLTFLSLSPTSWCVPPPPVRFVLYPWIATVVQG
jgi:hypothetical protein